MTLRTKENKMSRLDGCFNTVADNVERIDETWSDTNLDNNVFIEPFIRLKCRNCGGVEFEVLQTGSYETTAKCWKCKMYYEVHNG